MTRTQLVLILFAVTAAPGCPSMVGQNSHSGKDKSYKGAKKIELEDAGGGTLEGKAKGIVTYPGGDRADWKFFEIPPEKKNGEIEITLRNSPPRPGLDLVFDVFDEFGRKRGSVKAAPGKNKKRKSDTVKDAQPGKWFVRIYAPRRTDAGEYRLAVAFNETKSKIDPVDLEKLKGEIPDPPTLPAVAGPTKLTPEQIAACQKAFETCEAERVKCEEANKALAAGTLQPMTARILNPQIDSSGMVVITMDRGKKDGVDRGWAGNVLQGGPTGSPISGGSFNVISVRESLCVGKVKLSVDQVRQNPHARLIPPAGGAGPVACKECAACPVQ